MTLVAQKPETFQPKYKNKTDETMAHINKAVAEAVANPVKPREKVVSDYSGLSKQIREAGLLKRTIPFYAITFGIVTLLGIIAWTAVFMIGNSWWNLIPAAILGIFTAQYGFFAHEASHRQIFTSKKVNDWAGLIIADLFVGLGYGFWMKKHQKHHVTPNQIGEDPDINIRVLSFTKESYDSRKGLEKLATKNQGWMLPFLLLFTGFDLLLDSFKTVLNPKSVLKFRWLEIVFLTVRLATPLTIAFTLMDPILAFSFFMVNMMVFGFFMGGAFAPNHKGMPILPKDAKVDFLRRQVLTSRNIRPGFVMDLLMGGLNYQIEHHLFPSMPRPHLKEARRLTKIYCAERGIPYMETGLFESYSIVMKHLSKVGLSNNVDPFDCPVTAQFGYRS